MPPLPYCLLTISSRYRMLSENHRKCKDYRARTADWLLFTLLLLILYLCQSTITSHIISHSWLSQEWRHDWSALEMDEYHFQTMTNVLHIDRSIYHCCHPACRVSTHDTEWYSKIIGSVMTTGLVLSIDCYLRCYYWFST